MRWHVHLFIVLFVIRFLPLYAKKTVNLEMLRRKMQAAGKGFKLVGFYTRNIGPKNFSSNWIQALPSTNKSVKIWYPTGPSTESMYFLAERDTATKNVTLIGLPCGRIPSVGCFSAMLKVYTKNYTRSVCPKQTYNPILQNIPRWGLQLKMDPWQRKPFHADSQMISYLALTSVEAEMLKNSTNRCETDYVVPEALSRLTTVIHVSKNRTTAFFRKLKIRKTFNSTKYANTRMNSSIPLTTQQFSDLTVLMYNSLINSIDCSKKQYNINLLNGTRRTISTAYGQLDINSLYEDNTYTIREKNSSATNVTVFVANIIRDYLTRITLDHRFRTFISANYAQLRNKTRSPDDDDLIPL
ncbi:B74 [miniopterid betaherpesvirus 1]|uniref:B74 n=1 Tax=miniopterid betaherpesvirus 1 TaxID=3070189 RepID=I3VQ67_9BETA|nr:B74 [miniopterid betaherpesvirus 1]AFK83911.1 B74 [miniopterid betaherpesvirus 1]